MLDNDLPSTVQNTAAAGWAELKTAITLAIWIQILKPETQHQISRHPHKNVHTLTSKGVLNYVKASTIIPSIQEDVQLLETKTWQSPRYWRIWQTASSGSATVEEHINNITYRKLWRPMMSTGTSWLRVEYFRPRLRNHCHISQGSDLRSTDRK